MKSILISCATRLAPFDIKELRELTEYDEMNIEEILDKCVREAEELEISYHV